MEEPVDGGVVFGVGDQVRGHQGGEQPGDVAVSVGGVGVSHGVGDRPPHSCDLRAGTEVPGSAM
jgi:hypothetical protein